MATADELIVKIGADFDELRRELKTASDGVTEFGKDSQKASKVSKTSFDTILKSIKPVTVAITAATAAVGVITKKQLEAARSTELWADRLNMSRSEFSQLAAVGRRFGADIDDVGDSIKDLNERIADAAMGNKTYEEALNKAGLASKDLIDLPLEEQFIKVASAIGKMNNAGNQNFVTAELMADAGFRLLPMFRQGEEAIRGMKDEVLSTKEALTALEIDKMAEANRAFMDMASAFEGLANTITIKLAPAFSAMGKAINFVNDSLKTQELTEYEAELKGLREELETISGAREQGGKMLQVMSQEESEEQAARINAISKRMSVLVGLIKKSREEAEKSKNASSGKDKEKSGATPGVDQAAVAKSQELAAELKAQIRRQEIVDEQLKNAALLEEEEKHQAAVAKSKELAAELAAQVALEKAQEESMAIAEKQLAEAEAQEAYLQAKESYLDRELSMEERQAERLKWLWESGAKGKLMNAQKLFGQLSSLMNSENKKAFEVGKVAAIANATIDTYQAAMTNYKWGASIGGPPVGAAFAGVAVAAGMSNIQKISSTQFGSGGGGAGGGAGGDVSGAAGGDAEPTTQVLETNVTFAGDSISQEQFRGFVGGLNEAIDDGVTIGRINA